MEMIVKLTTTEEIDKFMTAWVGGIPARCECPSKNVEVEAPPEPEEDEAPIVAPKRRKRRTKAQIAADKKAEELIEEAAETLEAAEDDPEEDEAPPPEKKAKGKTAEAPENPVTLKQLRKMTNKAANAFGTLKVAKILEEYDAQVCNDLDPEEYPEVWAKLAALA